VEVEAEDHEELGDRHDLPLSKRRAAFRSRLKIQILREIFPDEGSVYGRYSSIFEDRIPVSLGGE
jgi:hypothetical protein